MRNEILKYYSFLFRLVLLLFISNMHAQQKMIVPEYEQGQLIVKLKDDVKASINYGNTNTKSGIARNEISDDIGKILGISQKIKKQEVLFSLKSIERSIIVRNKNIIKQDRLNNKPKNKGAQGSDPREDNQQFFSMKNVIKIEFEDPMTNIYEIIEQLKDNPKVDYVEPNYIFSINDYTIESDIVYDKDLKSSKKSNYLATNPSDPLYSVQSGIVKTNIDDVWTDYGTGDGSQIVAVLDTGVDYTHPDLKDNIWINEVELNGVEGFDDDGNGYVDDIRGWDFINDDNAPLDDNMHGTHVAGIIGAVGNNDKGIAGAAWNVKIMPIKVFQSSGRGNATDIALGVDYARIAGATIQNYSFGGFSESFTAKTAYENAYGNNAALLVAASGNNRLCIGPGICGDKRYGFPFYPAAYTYILGIEDGENDYDNYDMDGPLFSRYSDYLNYELKAVGTLVTSTVPDGGYRALSGTSMAAPLVAGAMALYLEQKPDDSKEIIFGNLINTAGNLVDFAAALDVTPTPLLKVLGAEVEDEYNNQNNNGFWEPGETLEIFPTIKNYWGPTDDVRLGIEFAEFEDQTKAELIETEIAIGSVSAYANLKITDKSLKIKLADGIANNVDIIFKLSVWSGDEKEYLSSEDFIINVKNSILLYGVKSSDITLYPEKEYLVSDNLAFVLNAKLTIKPGVTLKFSNEKQISFKDESKILAVGTKDSLINFIQEDNYWGGFSYSSKAKSKIEFAKFNGIYTESNAIIASDDLTLKYIIFQNLNARLTPTPISFSNSNYINNRSLYIDPVRVENSNFINNSIWSKFYFYDNYCCHGFYDPSDRDINGNNIFNNDVSLSARYDQTLVIDSTYLGSTVEETVRKTNWDFTNYSEHKKGLFDFSKLKTVPYENSPGIVWKVEVNGKDAQDEYDEMDPIGVGQHEFKVYFNREMDTLVEPQLVMEFVFLNSKNNL